MKKIKIAPSLLSADFTHLAEEIAKCEKAGADLLHIDVMDGSFVPNITIGPFIVEQIKKITTLPLDCHLMIVNPSKYFYEFAKAGADYLSFHTEADAHIHRSLEYIKSLNVKCGIALNPVTPLEYAYESAQYCDFILLMSVNPGFGGQDFIKSFLSRAEKLKNFLLKNNLDNVEIEVDGGVKVTNAKEIAQAGADILVSGSGLFYGDFQENFEKMKSQLENL